MFKKILLIVPFFITELAYGEWTKITTSSDANVYIEESTVRRSGDKVKVWNLFDFKVEQVVSGRRFHSARSMMEYDCVGENERLLSHSFHSLKMGLGNTVHTESAVGNWEPVSPTSIGRSLFDHLCQKDKYQSKKFPTVYSSWPSAGEDKNFEVRYDRSSIVKTGSNVSVWVLLNHFSPIDIERKKFKSTVIQSHIDCKRLVHRNGLGRAYTLKNGVGEYFEFPENNEWTKYNPGSITSKIAGIVCEDKKGATP
jgi:hypothetical protein